MSCVGELNYGGKETQILPLGRAIRADPDRPRNFCGEIDLDQTGENRPGKARKGGAHRPARSVVATGKIQPVTQVEIKSKASGIIQKLPVNVGDVVHKGQVICELDQNDLLPALRQQEAALHVAEAALKTAQADYDRYKVDAEGRDVPFLKRDMERAQKMFAGKLIAQNTRDDAEKNYEMAVQKQESAVAESRLRRRPRSPRPKPRSSSSRPRSRRRRRICATPPSFRPWMAWCFRATAKSARQ